MTIGVGTFPEVGEGGASQTGYPIVTMLNATLSQISKNAKSLRCNDRNDAKSK